MKKITTLFLLLFAFTFTYSQTQELKNGTFSTKSITVYKNINTDSSFDVNINGKIVIYDSAGSKYVRQSNLVTDESVTVKVLKYYNKANVQEGILYGYYVEDAFDSRSKGLLSILYDSAGKVTIIGISDQVSLILYTIYYISSL